MRRTFAFAVPVIVTCLIAGNVALAQGGRGRGGFGGFGQMGAAMLLGNPQVQKELKLAEDQIAKIKEINDKQKEPEGEQSFSVFS